MNTPEELTPKSFLLSFCRPRNAGRFSSGFHGGVCDGQNPLPEAIRLWRGGEEVWYQNPKFAPPAWINLFSSKKYAESFAVRTTDGTMTKEVTPGAEGTSTIGVLLHL